MLKQFAIAVGVLAFTVPAGAFTQIQSPNSTYVFGTSLLGVPAPTGPNMTFVTDGMLRVDFSSELRPRRVGVDWPSWGLPPETENNSPSIFCSLGEDSMTFTFDKPLGIWGFEVQGYGPDDQVFTLEFFDGANLVGTITRTINGTDGALLMAGRADIGEKFTSVRLSSDLDNNTIAMAQLRYGLAVIPEPATWAMLIAGFGLVGVAARRRREIAAHNA